MTAWTQEKTVVFTPMPMPNEPIMTAATTGMRRMVRQLWRRSVATRSLMALRE